LRLRLRHLRRPELWLRLLLRPGADLLRPGPNLLRPGPDLLRSDLRLQFLRLRSELWLRLRLRLR
jgi:hypothetical protein